MIGRITYLKYEVPTKAEAHSQIADTDSYKKNSIVDIHAILKIAGLLF